jgi:uncharacterized membrane protein
MMTEEQTQGTQPEPAVPPAGGADPNNPYGYPMEDVEEGKLFAILGYIIPFIFLVPLIQKDNHFSLFHAKQVLLLAIGGIGIMVLSMIPFLGCILFLLFLPWMAWVIMGLVFAIQGQYRPLLFIGDFAEEWFKGIKVEKR